VLIEASYRMLSGTLAHTISYEFYKYSKAAFYPEEGNNENGSLKLFS